MLTRERNDLSVTVLQGPSHRVLPRTIITPSFLLGTTDTKNHANPELPGPSLLSDGKSLLENQGSQEESKERSGEKKWWKREAIEFVVKSSRFGIK